MKKFPVPNNEEERLNRLSYYGLKDIGADSELLIFAEAASLITQCPSAFIGMMEED